MDPPALDNQKTEQDGNQFHFVMAVLDRFWKLIAVLTLAGTLLFIAYAVLRGPVSTTQFRAEIELGAESFGFAVAHAKAQADLSNLLLTPDDLLRRADIEEITRTAEDHFTRRSGGGNSPQSQNAPATLDGRFAIGVSSTHPNVLLVTATYPDPVIASTIAHAVASAVGDFQKQLLERRVRDAQAFLASELDSLAASLEQATASQLDYLNTYGVNTYEDISQQLRHQDAQLSDLYAQRKQNLAELGHVEEEIARVYEEFPGSLARVSDSLIADLFDEQQELVKTELNMAMIYQQAYPPLQRLREEIAEKEMTITEAVRRYRESGTVGFESWEYLMQLRNEKARLQSELTGLDAREATIHERSRSLAAELPLMAETAQGYARIVTEVEGFRTQYMEAIDRDFALRSAARVGFGLLEPIGPTRITELPPEQPNYLAHAFIGGCIGFLVSFGLALLLEGADTSIRSERDAHAHLQRTIIGTIPDMNARGGRARKFRASPAATGSNVAPAIVTVHEPKSPVSEAYRTARTNFQFTTFEQNPRVIMVTSSVPAEGKTTTSTNLAVAMAQNGSRVLLIDADMRRPHAHYLLGIERSPGLSDVLTGTAGAHDVIRTTGVPNLMIIPSGVIPDNPAELIGSDNMKNLLETLRVEFDVIVCDVPAVLVVTDALILARHVDSVLMVVAVHNARRQTILRALRLLETAKSQISGIVLNGLKSTRLRHYYYYYYYEDAAQPSRKRWYNE